jgi:hypothetical protein
MFALTMQTIKESLSNKLSDYERFRYFFTCQGI